jgi:hypothetical protein
MTVSTQLNRTRRRDVVSHLFEVGQVVRMKRWSGLSPKSADVFRIVATLPAKDNSLQYRIRSDDERHERVASEDTLERVDPAAGAGRTNLIERTFGHGQGTKA